MTCNRKNQPMGLAWWVSLLAPAMAAAYYSDIPQPGQLHINCGSTNLYTQEQYLDLNSGSVPGYANTGLLTNSTVRTANNSAYFSYHIPVAATSTPPLRLSFHAKGQIKASVEGTVLLNTTSAYTEFAPFDYALTNSALWSDGYVDVRFDDAATGDGNGPSVAWVELWASSEWRERVKHVLWDSSSAIWNLGGYDGREHEFRGTATNVVVGADVSLMTNTGPIWIRWTQPMSTGKQYVIVTAVRNVGNSFTMDMQADGSVEYTSSYVNTNLPRGWYWAREVVGRLDITDQIGASNVLKITLAPGGPNPDCMANRLDSIALVEVTPGHIQDADLRVVFKGNEQADNWTKLVNSTLFFSGHLYLDWSTGEWRTSSPNGEFEWFGGDSSAQLRELARWGYHAPARQAARFLHHGRNVYTEQQGGVGSAAQAAASIAYLMMLDNYTGSFCDDIYPSLQYFCDLFADAVETDPRHLTKETHYEGGGPYHTAADNTATYAALRFGAQIAQARGQSADATRWSAAASNQLIGINSNLILSTPMTWTNYTSLPGWPPPAPRVATNILPAGTFVYGLNDAGIVPTNAYAGLWTAGHHEEVFFGYRGDSSTLSAWRSAMNTMLDYHPATNFTDDWRRHGDNYGVGTSYGALSEGGGRIMTSMLLSDRMDLFQKNLMHVIWNSTDVNFSGTRTEETFGEISPWVLVYDIDRQDELGWYSSESWDCEDMNGIEYADCMKNARVMAGVDDTLYGGDNLIIIPRLPVSWNQLKVNEWPVAYRNGSTISQATVTFDFRNTQTNGSIDITASSPMSAVKVRFGPFDPASYVAAATTNGVAVSHTTETRGNARWVWVTTDIGPVEKTINVRMANSNLTVYSDFSDGTLAGWTTNGGAWSSSGGLARVVTTGSARSAYASVTGQAPSVTADIKVESASLGTAPASAGIGLWQDGTGTLGYTLVGDFTNRQFRLMRDSTVLASDYVNFKPNRTYRMKLVISTNIDCYLDEVKVFSVADSTYTGGSFGLVASNGTVCFDNAALLSVPPPVPPGDWTAYNDCAYDPSETNGAFSLYGDPSPGIFTTNSPYSQLSGSLIDMTAGAMLTARVTFNTNGAVNVTRLNRGFSLPSGTDAATWFAGKIGTNCAAQWTSGTVTMTLTNLDAARQYNVVIWSTRGGDGAIYSNRFTDILISGASSFSNRSTAGVEISTVSTAGDKSRIRSALTPGLVARYDAVNPGSDGVILFQLTAGADSLWPTSSTVAGYINAFMIQALPPGYSSNGIPDSWKMAYFGSTNGPYTGDFEDYDNDGFSNYAEWRAGTIPTNAVSRLIFSSAAFPQSGTSSHMVVSWSGVTGKNYGLMFVSTMTGNWSSQQTGIAGIAPMNIVTVPVINPAGFWRVRVE